MRCSDLWHLDKLHQLDGVEKVKPHHLLWPAAVRRHLSYRQRRGIACNDTVVADRRTDVSVELWRSKDGHERESLWRHA